MPALLISTVGADQQLRPDLSVAVTAEEFDPRLVCVDPDGADLGGTDKIEVWRIGETLRDRGAKNTGLDHVTPPTTGRVRHSAAAAAGSS